LLNEALRKKLTDVRRAARETPLERAVLAHQIQSQKQENQRLRQSLAAAGTSAQALKVDHEAPDEQAKTAAGELAKADGAPRQEIKNPDSSNKAARKTEESWARRLFSSRKKPPVG